MKLSHVSAPRFHRAAFRHRVTVGVAFVAASLAATRSNASAPQMQCTTDRAGSWTVSVNGPMSVACADGSECTELAYHIVPASGSRHSRAAAVLVEHDIAVVEPPDNDVSEPCRGDRRTRLGLNDCSRKAVRIALDPGGSPKDFSIVATGLRDVVESSIAIRAAGGIEGCRIASLGSVAFHPNQQVLSSQQIMFKGCAVTIPTDPVTGEGGPATITGSKCAFVANAAPVTTAELKIDGKSVGALSFGEGSLSSGKASCTTKIVNRRLYTWCTCADVTGDGIPDDPIPPCVRP